ncbi:MAG TPA: UDP-N-acetylmuramoyl-L-alanine--D-glutamate ligase [Labilithrix sp.]|nr:UDP-N-acetylmuramoyl-L-alanine--D-glutamate ligase [Labilithrix sp.]
MMSAPRSVSLADKRVVVVGLGLSGVAACRLLVSRGAKVTATDRVSLEAASEAVRALESEGITLALGGHENAHLVDADLIVVSPGVPSFPELELADAAGVPIWGEVELAVRAVNEAALAAGRPAPRLIAIGGTNGKSTVTSLVGALLERSGLRIFVGGNLGEPLAAHADEPFDVLVLEVSSFQMERVDAFHPQVSVLLNITPDHLDRYPGEVEYANAKGNAFLRQTSADLAVVPVGDEACLTQARRGAAQVVTFGAGGDLDVRADAIVDKRNRDTYKRAQIGLQGGHNALNVAAAIAAVEPFGLDDLVIEEVLERFRGLPHRMALVRSRGGVRWYDDSKGTNVGATVTAVRGVGEERVVLIAGGRDKGGSYEPLVAALAEKGRAAILIGEAAPIIRDAIGEAIPVRMATSMKDAVILAATLAQPGDAVLLSPACSSFDMFRDYKERGDVFVAAVQGLANGTGPLEETP